MRHSTVRRHLPLPLKIAEEWTLVVFSTLLGYGTGSLVLRGGGGIFLACLMGFLLGGMLMVGAPALYRQRIKR